jgi:hypothetical protein
MDFELCEISAKEAIDFILPLHYSGRKAPVSFAFAIKMNGIIKAAVTFGKPASSTLCPSICGKQFSSKVYELNRLCRTDDCDLQLSILVGFALRKLRNFNLIIVSYSDSAMHHCGYIYQACNFIFTGKTKKRIDNCLDANKHARHYGHGEIPKVSKIRSSKNRYVYFAANKRYKKIYAKSLTWPILPYPKEKNENYVLGEFLKEKFITLSGN